jgi:hypothetical protein
MILKPLHLDIPVRSCTLPFSTSNQLSLLQGLLPDGFLLNIRTPVGSIVQYMDSLIFHISEWVNADSVLFADQPPDRAIAPA